jgi:hypothetical protein
VRNVDPLSRRESAAPAAAQPCQLSFLLPPLICPAVVHFCVSVTIVVALEVLLLRLPVDDTAFCFYFNSNLQLFGRHEQSKLPALRVLQLKTIVLCVRQNTDFIRQL